ncbi:MAG TPA: hypothetical protein VFW23_11255 [Tepidisphaeraceae bacterium]|nr:hypothetical protein [Tepidisphaeraceae bacterium]
MRRRLVKIGFVLSLSFCVLSLALLVLSYWYLGTFHHDYLTQKPTDLRFRIVFVAVGRGEVRIDDQLFDMPAPPPIPSVYSNSRSREARSIVRRQQLQLRQWKSQGRFIAAQTRSDNRLPMFAAQRMDDPPPIVSIKTRLGFAFNLDRNKGPGSSYKLQVMLPLWSFPIIPLLMALIFCRFGKLDPLKCAKCGYDLRGTPDRCPECGTPGQRLSIPSLKLSPLPNV